MTEKMSEDRMKVIEKINDYIKELESRSESNDKDIQLTIDIWKMKVKELENGII